MDLEEMDRIVKEAQEQTEAFKAEIAEIEKISPLRHCPPAYVGISPRQRRELPVTGYGHLVDQVNIPLDYSTKVDEGDKNCVPYSEVNPFTEEDKRKMAEEFDRRIKEMIANQGTLTEVASFTQEQADEILEAFRPMSYVISDDEQSSD